MNSPALCGAGRKTGAANFDPSLSRIGLGIRQFAAMISAVMYEAIHWLSRHHALEILIALGFVLVLVDYFFRTDVPAHFGYLCFSPALFFCGRTVALG